MVLTDFPLDELSAELQEGQLLLDADRIESFRRDRTTAVSPGTPCAVVEALSAIDVVTTMQWATRYRVPVVIRGGGTSLAGGATALDGGIVLSVARMNSIREMAADERLAVVEPGVITVDLDAAARAHDLMYAPDPSSYESCTIGGNLATNAGGLRCLKYGVTRESVLGMEVVLADGTRVRTGRRTSKGVVGYDLTALFVGSEGTLGVIVSATMRLRPAPRSAPVTVLATFRSVVRAGEAAFSILRCGIEPSILELMDGTTTRAIDEWKHFGAGPQVAAMIIAQYDGRDGALAGSEIAEQCHLAGADEVLLSTSESESRQLLDLRRLAYPAIERLGSCLVEDVCVPIPALPAMIEKIATVAATHEVVIATVAHAGDGNLHPIFVFDHGLAQPPDKVWAAADEVFREALALGGTLTGEHGVGSIKRRWLTQELSEESLALHHTVKRALDPLGILNPGRGI
jgi:glycolate oxidase